MERKHVWEIENFNAQMRALIFRIQKVFSYLGHDLVEVFPLLVGDHLLDFQGRLGTFLVPFQPVLELLVQVRISGVDFFHRCCKGDLQTRVWTMLLKWREAKRLKQNLFFGTISAARLKWRKERKKLMTIRRKIRLETWELA